LARGGIGQLMFTYFLYEVDPNPIVVTMVAVGIVGLLLDQALRGAGWLAMPWRRSGQ
jgi:ABC-type nitrate/sulfonate/bicarbonate transport system permease component